MGVCFSLFLLWAIQGYLTLTAQAGLEQEKAN